jgi:hypothetical protein
MVFTVWQRSFAIVSAGSELPRIEPLAVRRIPLTGPWALGLGVVLIGVAVYQFLTSSALATRGVEAVATVVDVDSRLRRSSNGYRKRTYRLTLEFEDQRGATRRERTGYGRSYGGHRVGDRVEVVYNPANPSEFALDSWHDLWAMPAGLAVVGAIACSGFLFGPARAG